MILGCRDTWQKWRQGQAKGLSGRPATSPPGHVIDPCAEKHNLSDPKPCIWRRFYHMTRKNSPRIKGPTFQLQLPQDMQQSMEPTPRVDLRHSHRRRWRWAAKAGWPGLGSLSLAAAGVASSLAVGCVGVTALSPRNRIRTDLEALYKEPSPSLQNTHPRSSSTISFVKF